MSLRVNRRAPRSTHLLLAALAGCAAGGVGLPACAQPAELWVGAAATSITPDQPVALIGSMASRISRSVHSPVMAEVLALESRRGGQVVDQAIFVACDLAVLRGPPGIFRGGVVDKIRQRIKSRLPGFDTQKLVVSATHTHAAPAMAEGEYDLPKDGLMQPGEYLEFLIDRLGEAIERAWQSRAPGSVGWGLGHAVVARNRRTVYADGHAEMYGKTDRRDFRGLEGYEDHGVGVLLFWDRDQKLVATAIDVACPAQVMGTGLAITADYWHEVRKRLCARHGEGLVVLGWIGAAGDQSPTLPYGRSAEARMLRLRGLSPVEEIGRRIAQAWEETYQAASKDRRTDVPLAHTVQTIQLPMRKVTAEESAKAQAEAAKLAQKPLYRLKMQWHQRVVDRYEEQQAGRAMSYPMELHVVRLGDVAIATNDFELFTDYGIQIQARSPAVQTFVIQLAGPATYLPSQRAVRAGGYSAIVENNLIGPEGGQVLVDRTVKAIEDLWPKPAR